MGPARWTRRVSAAARSCRSGRRQRTRKRSHRQRTVVGGHAQAAFAARQSWRCTPHEQDSPDMPPRLPGEDPEFLLQRLVAGSPRLPVHARRNVSLQHAIRLLECINPSTHGSCKYNRNPSLVSPCLGSQFNWNLPTVFCERLLARYAAGCISLSSFSRAAFAQSCQRGNFGVTLPL